MGQRQALSMEVALDVTSKRIAWHQLAGDVYFRAYHSAHQIVRTVVKVLLAC